MGTEARLRTGCAPHVGGANHFPAVVNQNHFDIGEEAGKRGSDPRWHVKPSEFGSRCSFGPVSFILVAAESRRELVLDGKGKNGATLEWNEGQGEAAVWLSLAHIGQMCV